MPDEWSVDETPELLTARCAEGAETAVTEAPDARQLRLNPD
jgi:hypothetical protein